MPGKNIGHISFNNQHGWRVKKIHIDLFCAAAEKKN
jgi:hypothetical protein